MPIIRPPEPKLSVTVSLQQKVNFPGKYESADVFLSVSGVTEDTTPDEMDTIIGQGKIAYSKLAKAISEKVNNLRYTGGVAEEDDE